MSPIKAISLFSGGLDSSLAVKLIQSEGIEVIGFHFVLPFYTPMDEPILRIEKLSKELGIEIEFFYGGEDYIQIIKNPKYGYGENMNPCIDCKIFMLKKAKIFMEKIGASFLFSGEVLNQRPMSQRKNVMNLIEREAGVKGLLLRPLSAKLLEITIPEKRGWVKRENLLALSGRTRKQQFALAERFEIKNYATPSGGCYLTDPQYSLRLKEAFQHEEDKIEDLRLLRIGRHFRLKNGAKLIIGRDKKENELIENLANEEDFLIEGVGFGSPLGLLKKSKDEMDIELAASICMRYSKKRKEKSVRVIIRNKNKNLKEKEVTPMDKRKVEEFLIR
ncbi:MAG: tRNA 4-thiouridine(8) synthase ThiI [candidate division WOR-3 bacterium]